MSTRPPTIAMNPVDGMVASLARTLSRPLGDHPAAPGFRRESHAAPGKTGASAAVAVVRDDSCVDGVAQPAPSAAMSAAARTTRLPNSHTADTRVPEGGSVVTLLPRNRRASSGAPRHHECGERSPELADLDVAQGQVTAM